MTYGSESEFATHYTTALDAGARFKRQTDSDFSMVNFLHIYNYSRLVDSMVDNRSQVAPTLFLIYAYGKYILAINTCQHGCQRSVERTGNGELP